MKRTSKKRPTASVRSPFALALHDFDSLRMQDLMADRIRTAADLADARRDELRMMGHSACIDIPEETTIHLRDSTCRTEDEVDAAIRRWRIIASCMINPVLGFQTGLDPRQVESIRNGFGSLDAVSGVLRDYVAAGLFQQDSRETVRVHLSMPAGRLEGSVELSSSSILGSILGSIMAPDYDPASKEMSSLLNRIAPRAYAVSFRRSTIHIDPLKMQHDEVTSIDDPVDTLRILGRPELKGMSSVIVVPIGERDDDGKEDEDDR